MLYGPPWPVSALTCWFIPTGEMPGQRHVQEQCESGDRESKAARKWSTAVPRRPFLCVVCYTHHWTRGWPQLRLVPGSLSFFTMMLRNGPLGGFVRHGDSETRNGIVSSASSLVSSQSAAEAGQAKVGGVGIIIGAFTAAATAAAAVADTKIGCPGWPVTGTTGGSVIDAPTPTARTVSHPDPHLQHLERENEGASFLVSLIFLGVLSSLYLTSEQESRRLSDAELREATPKIPFCFLSFDLSRMASLLSTRSRRQRNVGVFPASRFAALFNLTSVHSPPHHLLAGFPRSSSLSLTSTPLKNDRA